MTCKACLMLLGKISSISSYAKNQLVKESTFMPFSLNAIVLLNHKFGKCQKSASGWENVQIVIGESLLTFEPSVLSSKVL